MTTATVVISGVSALFGTLGAISFQLWREKMHWVNKGNALINQLISLIQHQRIIIETFDENHDLFTGSGNMQIPSPPPNTIIDSSLIVDVAEHLDTKNFEIFATAISCYESFYKHAIEIREYNSEVEKRLLDGKSLKPSPVELKRLSEHSENFKGVLKSGIETHKKVQEILLVALDKRMFRVFDSNGALNNWPALLLLYMVIVSFLALVFGFECFSGEF